MAYVIFRKLSFVDTVIRVILWRFFETHRHFTKKIEAEKKGDKFEDSIPWLPPWMVDNQHKFSPEELGAIGIAVESDVVWNAVITESFISRLEAARYHRQQRAWVVHDLLASPVWTWPYSVKEFGIKRLFGEKLTGEEYWDESDPEYEEILDKRFFRSLPYEPDLLNDPVWAWPNSPKELGIKALFGVPLEEDDEQDPESDIKPPENMEWETDEELPEVMEWELMIDPEE